MIVVALFCFSTSRISHMWSFLEYGYFLAVFYVATWKIVPKAAVLSGVGITVVLAASMFGHRFYGHVRGGVGGGKPDQVHVILDEANTPSAVKKLLGITDGVSSEVALIAQTDSEIFLAIPALGVTKSEKGAIDPDEPHYAMLIRVERKLVRAITQSTQSTVARVDR